MAGGAISPYSGGAAVGGGYARSAAFTPADVAIKIAVAVPSTSGRTRAPPFCTRMITPSAYR